MVDKVFYNAKGDAIPVSYVEDVGQVYKGTTLDGDPVYHTTYFREGRHISYDTVVIRGEHHYIIGSGHETSHQYADKSQWNMGNIVNWQDALRMHTRDLIHQY